MAVREPGNDFIRPNALVQAKLAIGKPNDKYEIEADRVAEKVVDKSSSTKPESIQDSSKTSLKTASPTLPVQKRDTKGTEEKEGVKEEEATETDIQTKGVTSATDPPEDDTTNIQEKPLSASITSVTQLKTNTEEPARTKSESNKSGTDVESSLKSSKGKGSPMDNVTRSSMESGFGSDFSAVRIHTDSNAVQMNKDLGAKAFTNGPDIYFNEGQYNPSSKEGQHLLAHELTHTVQQGASSANSVQKADDPETDYGAAISAEREKVGDEQPKKQEEAPVESPTDTNAALPYPGEILNHDKNEETIQRSVEDFGHSEDSAGPMREMEQKREEEGIDENEAQNSEESDEERPDRSELNETKGELQEDAKPDADRKAENAPKINEKAKEVENKIEEGGEVEGEETKNEEPQEQKPPLSPAEQAKANAQAAFDKSQTFKPPTRPKDVKDPQFKTPKDSAGEELPVNPEHAIKTVAMSTQIRLHRERAYNLKTGAIAEKAKAEELRGSIEIGKSGVHESNEVIEEYKLHSQARRENVEDIESHIVEANRRADWVAEKAPELNEKAVEGSEETTSMAEESADQQSNVEGVADDPETRETNRETSGELGNSQEGAQSADTSMKQMAEVNEQLGQEAVDAKTKNAETSEVLRQAHENISTGEEKLQADSDLNVTALGRFDEMSAQPDDHIKKANTLEAAADKAIRESEEQEDKMHTDLEWYYSNLEKTPAKPDPADYKQEAEGEGETPNIQRAIFSGPGAEESGLTMADAERFNADAQARQEFLNSIENSYQRKLAENELEMIRNFNQMDSDDREWYAMGVAWNQLMAGVTENGFSGFLKEGLAVAFYPPATARFMWHLMWPDTTNDPWWVAGLRYAAGWTSAAAILFGSLWSFSLVGFLIGSALTLFPFTIPAGMSMVGIFGPLMQIFGALFEMAAYISTIFHLLTLAYDLHEASNAENAEELSETSDQVADDVQRGMVAYLGTAMMFLGPYIAAILGKTPLGRWWVNFQKWFSERQLRAAEIRAAEITPPRTTVPNPEGDLVAGSEFAGEGLRMNEQPFEGRGTGEVEPTVPEGETPAPEGETVPVEEPAPAAVDPNLTRLSEAIGIEPGRLDGFTAAQLEELANLAENLNRDRLTGLRNFLESSLEKGRSPNKIMESLDRPTQELNAFLEEKAGIRWEPNWRGEARIEDGNISEGWEHIEGRHIDGTHPEGAGDLFPEGTTRAELEGVAQEVVSDGNRISPSHRRIQTFEKRVSVNGRPLRVRVIVDAADGRVITMFPVISGP